MDDRRDYRNGDHRRPARDPDYFRDSRQAPRGDNFRKDNGLSCGGGARNYRAPGSRGTIPSNERYNKLVVILIILH